MSQKLTPARLIAFADAVQKLAHEHLGANGVKGIAIGLDYDTYNDIRASAFMDRNLTSTAVTTAQNLPHEGLTFFSFVTVGYVENFPAFQAAFKFR